MKRFKWWTIESFENAERLSSLRDRNECINKENKTHHAGYAGKGLLNAISDQRYTRKQNRPEPGRNKRQWVAGKTTHGNIILAPPLVITEEQVHECCDIIERGAEPLAFQSLKTFLCSPFSEMMGWPNERIFFSIPILRTFGEPH